MTFKRQLWLKGAISILLVIGTAVIVTRRGSAEIIVPRLQLDGLPLNIGAWSGRDLRIDAEVLEVLGQGDFLFRTYVLDGQKTMPVQAFIAYFASQRVGDTMHSPRNCLPGAGWEPTESSYIALKTPDGQKFAVNRYVVQKGDERQLVLYWYQAHGRIVASEYWAKYYLVRDAMRMNRSDGALVRITTPMVRDESWTDAEKRAVDLSESLLVRLGGYIPN
jgi:EpsI family protein